MPETELPACLRHLETHEWGPELVLARCDYNADTFDDDAYARARIEAPPALETAVAKRRTEYLAGRLCARIALQDLGIQAVPTSGKDRAPRWPAGAVGAITHSRGRAAALVGAARRWQGLGLDTERWLAPARARRLSDEILTAGERESIENLDDNAFARRLTRVFSIKESLFKALYPLTGQRFYFQDAAMMDEHTIALRRTLSDHWRKGTRLPVRWRDEEDGVLSWIAVPR